VLLKQDREHRVVDFPPITDIGDDAEPRLLFPRPPAPVTNGRQLNGPFDSPAQQRDVVDENIRWRCRASRWARRERPIEKALRRVLLDRSKVPNENSGL
jgi:hypothetical protein